MRDVTGGYEYCFYCMGTCMVLGGVPLLLVTYNGEEETSGNCKIDRLSTTATERRTSLK